MLELAGTSSTDAEGLAGSISDSEPRFSFFRYTHSLDGTLQASLVFIYTCPPGSKIRERMIYASAKAGVIRAAEDELGLAVAKKVRAGADGNWSSCSSDIVQFEASSPSEITASTIEDEFRPKQEQKQGFSRPKPPRKR